MTTTSFDPVEDVCGRIEFAQRLYHADLAAMSDEGLCRSGGGKSRCAYDFTFELAGLYGFFAQLLQAGSGEIPPPQGWVRAPEDFKSRAVAVEALDSSLAAFVTALRTYRGDVVRDAYPSPVGDFTPLNMANLAVWHTMYHSGQINYIQTIDGDDAFHWI